jgi:hypothetical protein
MIYTVTFLFAANVACLAPTALYSGGLFLDCGFP